MFKNNTYQQYSNMVIIYKPFGNCLFIGRFIYNYSITILW